MSAVRPLCAVLAAVIFLVPFRAPAQDSKDLSEQFSSGCRNQGDVPACHSFSSVAILEAAIYRRHGKILGKRLELSEADLYLRRIVGGESYYAPIAENILKSLSLAPPQRLDADFDGRGHVSEDIQFALANGVATAEAAPWREFAKRYARYQAEQMKMVEAEFERCQSDVKSADALAKAGEQVRCLAVKSSALQRARYFLTKLSSETPKEAERVILGSDPELQNSRDFVHGLTKGFVLRFRVFPRPPEAEAADAKSEAKCLAAGREQRELSLYLMRHGLPAIFDMYLTGLPEWANHGPPLKGTHAFAVSNFKLSEKGKLVYKTRNSWDGLNPDVPEKRLCRVSRITYVLTDSEQGLDPVY